MKVLIKVIIAILIVNVGINNVCFSKKKTKVKSDDIMYLMVNDTLEQSLDITYITENKIHFLISSKNIRTKRENIISGVAKTNSDYESLGSESFTDDVNGLGVFCREFIYETDSCYISINIETSCKCQAIVIEGEGYGCLTNKYKECPITSIRNLRRVCQ